MPRVGIVGGGLAGLFTASELIASGIDDLLVFEGSDRAGGVARTTIRDGYSLEPAAGTMMLPHPHLSTVLTHLGVDTTPAAATAARRYLWLHGSLIELPASPAALTIPIAPLAARLRALGEMVASSPAPPDESLDAFMRRRFGDGVGRIGAWLAASGVFAGDPSELDAEAALPRLPALERRDGSITRGMIRMLRSRPPGTPRPAPRLPAGGMTAVADAAAAILGDRLRLSTPVSSVRRDGRGWKVDGIAVDRVVLACDPHAAADLVGGDLAHILRQAVTAPVVVLGLGGPEGSFPIPPGFGILTGPDSAMAIRGVLLESSYAPGRAPAGHSLVKIIAGGHPDTGVTELDDAAIVRLLGGEAARILGADIDAEFVELVRHRRGIPQYPTGHLRWLRSVEDRTPPGLHLTGWGYRGVGLAHQASEAVRLASEVGDSRVG